MANQVNMLVTTKNGNKAKTNTITHVNPEAADSSLTTFASSLFSLSKNTLVGVSVAEKRSLDLPDPTPAKTTPVLCLTVEGAQVVSTEDDGIDYEDPEQVNPFLSELGFGRSDTNVVTLPVNELNGGNFNLYVKAADDLNEEFPGLSEGNTLRISYAYIETVVYDEETDENIDGSIEMSDRNVSDYVTVEVQGETYVSVSCFIEWDELDETGAQNLKAALNKGFAITVETRETDKYLAGERTFVIKIVMPADE